MWFLTDFVFGLCCCYVVAVIVAIVEAHNAHLIYILIVGNMIGMDFAGIEIIIQVDFCMRIFLRKLDRLWNTWLIQGYVW